MSLLVRFWSRLHGRRRATRGQTLVEVALVLPIFLLTMLAIIELGWFAAISAATASASREAARYGSTVGTVGSPAIERYRDCAGIRDAARDTTNPLITLADADIIVTYDDGTSTAVAEPCVSASSRPDASELDRWDRVVVQVTVTYQPIVPLLAPLIGSHELVSTDRRSIAKPSP